MFIACSLCVDIMVYGLHAISHLLLTTNLWKRLSHCFRFTDGTTEAQRSAVSCSGSHSKWQSWDQNPKNTLLRIWVLLMLKPVFSHLFWSKARGGGERVREVRLFKVLGTLGHVKGATSCHFGQVGNKQTLTTRKVKI